MVDLMPVLQEAHAVALLARVNTLDAFAVANMRDRAEQLLPEGHELRAAVINFATLHEIYRRDPYGLAKIGEQLGRAVDAALDLTPRAAAYRSDIDG